MNNAKEERVTDLSIIMEMIDSKPYYSVQYRNVGEIGCHIGYSSYNLKTVLEFIGEYFEIVENDRQTNADRIRNMSDKELVELITGLSKECLAGIGECDCSAHKTCTNCNVEVRKWLQSEAKQSRRKEDDTIENIEESKKRAIKAWNRRASNGTDCCR